MNFLLNEQWLVGGFNTIYSEKSGEEGEQERETPCHFMVFDCFNSDDQFKYYSVELFSFLDSTDRSADTNRARDKQKKGKGK